MSTATLDATGLKCPLPVLKARKAIKPLAAGETLTIRATDPGFPADIRAFCNTTGHSLILESEADGVFLAEIRKESD